MQTPSRSVPSLVVAVLLAAAALQGCSFIFVDSAPPRPIGSDVSCTESRIAPGVDLTLGILYGLGSLGWTSVATDNTGTYTQDQKSTAAAIAVGAAAWGVLYGASSIYGFSKTRTCRDLKASIAEKGAFCDTTSQCAVGLECIARHCARPLQEASPTPAGGCSRDTDCKGERVCESGTCVEPRRGEPVIRTPSVDLGPAPRSSASDELAMEEMWKSRGAAIAPCVRDARSREDLPAGHTTLVMTLVVAPDGSIARIQIREPTSARDSGLERCLVDVMGEWRLDPGAVARPVDTSVSFSLP